MGATSPRTAQISWKELRRYSSRLSLATDVVSHMHVAANTKKLLRKTRWMMDVANFNARRPPATTHAKHVIGDSLILSSKHARMLMAGLCVGIVAGNLLFTS
jgi:hypothetical protein